uniref:Apple domain-containing protein n=1 Tax=Elaeophora elaphi TaxID=1147741 RepID=A0A0R3RNJ0_9BILA
MQLNFTTTIISVVLALIMAYVRASAIIEECCNLHSIENIQQNDEHLKNFIDDDNKSNSDDYNGNNNSGNISDIRGTDEYSHPIISLAATLYFDPESGTILFTIIPMYFQKNYDEEFYEFPLDELITASFDNFYTFCNITKQKLACWNLQCEMSRKQIPWSSDLHICAFKRLQFENALSCLK